MHTYILLPLSWCDQKPFFQKYYIEYDNSICKVLATIEMIITNFTASPKDLRAVRKIQMERKVLIRIFHLGFLPSFFQWALRSLQGRALLEANHYEIM